MPKINVLSFAVANLIAAGEVVDRPASVVKELMENAIDAGAGRITVEIQDGGVTFLRVTDNGCGMEKEDLPVAIKRHATSKIRCAEDLGGIATLGFRGEALAATCAVAKVRIISKPRDAETGAVLEVEAGEVQSLSDRGAADGTTVIVEDLFFNVPARRKFLKKDVTEAMAVTANVEKVAVSHPEIAFTLISDGNVKLETAGDGNLKNTLWAIYGKEFASRLLPVHGESDGVTVDGFVGRTDNVKANRNYENFFINHRYVRSKTAVAALEQAFVSYLPQERFPVAVLFLDIDPARVDVNVHPAKLEVKFTNEKPVFEALYYAVKSALEQNETRPVFKLPTPPRMTDRTVPVENGRRESLSSAQLRMGAAPSDASVQPSLKNGGGAFRELTAEEYLAMYVGKSASVPTAGNTENPQAKTETSRADADIPAPPATPEEALAGLRTSESERENYPEPQQPAKPEDETVPSAFAGVNAESAPAFGAFGSPAGFPFKKRERMQSPLYDRIPSRVEKQSEPEPGAGLDAYHIIGEAFHSYVLVEREDKLYVIDKHAAHERVIFERLKASLKNALREKATAQMLMLPLEVMLLTEEVAALEEYRGELEAIGFAFKTERNTVTLTAIPYDIDADDVSDVLTAMAGQIVSGTGNPTLTRDILFEKALYQASCKAAVKAGRMYPREGIGFIIADLMKCPDITFCPHGRPVALELPKQMLDNQFKRT